MMKQLVATAAVGVFIAGTASAQNAQHIERASAGQSCANCNLFQADLSFGDYSNASFEGSRLRQADLSISIFDGSNFAGANLSVANLFGVRMTGANLSGADLTNATLVGAYLGGASLSGATLTGANLSGAEMATTRGLTQAQLTAACGDRYTELPQGFTIPAC